MSDSLGTVTHPLGRTLLKAHSPSYHHIYIVFKLYVIDLYHDIALLIQVIATGAKTELVVASLPLAGPTRLRSDGILLLLSRSNTPAAV